MYVLQLSNVSKYFGATCLFENIKMDIGMRDRVALVGRNGAGKSTLLKIIIGETSYDSGDVFISKETTVGYLAQSSALPEQSTVWEAMIETFAHVIAIEKDLRNIEQQLANCQPNQYDALLKRYETLSQTFEDLNGYAIESEARSILHGLGFQHMHNQTVQTLSGGQRTRLALGKMLLRKPDLLILDEPTNHLDLTTLQWLENYLKNYDHALLIVSHDRYFLDEVVDVVYELQHGQGKRYVGNYSDYTLTRMLEQEQYRKLFEKQQEEIARTKEFIDKNIARASTTKRAQSRRKQLERMELMDRPLSDQGSAKVTFLIDRPSGNDVLRLEQLTVGYKEALCAPIDQLFTRGQRIALIGDNGIGKSTLLKTIVNEHPAISGSFKLGAHVSLGYYSQEHDALNPQKTVINELWDDWPMMVEKDVRTVLGNFLFSGEDVFKTVRELSGGERARLVLAKLMLQKNNFLVLDEPTNHLDLDAKEVLESSLQNYEGTLLFVSHDRYFINSVADHIFHMEKEKVTFYLGDYDYYVEKIEENRQRAALEEQAIQQKETKPAVTDYQKSKEIQRQERQKQRKIEEIEKTIATTETEIQQTQELMCLPENIHDFQKIQDLQSTLETKETHLAELYDEWEKLQN
ncbi:MAG: ABC-F family ATP-binding cassette domain-containing protein [Bacilli bacterium]